MKALGSILGTEKKNPTQDFLLELVKKAASCSKKTRLGVRTGSALSHRKQTHIQRKAGARYGDNDLMTLFNPCIYLFQDTAKK